MHARAEPLEYIWDLFNDIDLRHRLDIKSVNFIDFCLFPVFDSIEIRMRIIFINADFAFDFIEFVPLFDGAAS